MPTSVWLSVCPSRQAPRLPPCLDLLPVAAWDQSCPAAPGAAASGSPPTHPASPLLCTVLRWGKRSSCLWALRAGLCRSSLQHRTDRGERKDSKRSGKLLTVKRSSHSSLRNTFYTLTATLYITILHLIFTLYYQFVHFFLLSFLPFSPYHFVELLLIWMKVYLDTTDLTSYGQVAPPVSFMLGGIVLLFLLFWNSFCRLISCSPKGTDLLYFGSHFFTNLLLSRWLTKL